MLSLAMLMTRMGCADWQERFDGGDAGVCAAVSVSRVCV